ncbi:hypothetical protein [Sphingomonas sp.]|uniref:hypothetical protein n=1 Tax=Sphingomonas sp. TaxID=28214 RepID=UPI002DD63601|nr:hypothetical protein [Sphingomonas sp.]
MIVESGRPLWFLGAVAGGWVAIRVAIVWQATGSLPEAVREVMPLPIAAIAAVPIARPEVAPALSARPANGGEYRAVPAMLARVRPAGALPNIRSVAEPAGAIPPGAAPVQLALLAMTPSLDIPAPAAAARPSIVIAPALHSRAPSRFSVSSWIIARGGTGLGASALAPQLGGTQGGVRVDYALRGGVAATARIAAPAAGAGRELSVGVAWRPAAVPIRLVAEQRLALDGGRGGPALGISGGVSELPLPAGLRLEGYGQAGAILRDGIERYVDGSARVARPVARFGDIAIDAGGGVWGGAQRGVARLDIGPSVGARLPVAGRTMRLAVDWRQRVGGGARPGSGPALTLGSDF